MRLLIISYFYPPMNLIGAVRVGRMAGLLARMGHDVTVVCAGGPNSGTASPADHVRVIHTRSIELPEPAQVGPVESPADSGRRTNVYRSVYRPLRYFYRNAVWVPDKLVGWVPFAVAAGLWAARTARPDVILASGPPVASLLAAATIAKLTSTPWVAELRDLWSDNPYFKRRAFQINLDRRTERRVLSSASGLITSTRWMRDHLARRYSVPIEYIYTGRDRTPLPRIVPQYDPRLSIVHTGRLYQGKRDLTPVLEGLRLLGRRATGCRLVLAGPDLGLISDRARSLVEAGVVELLGEVPYSKSIELQMAADILLLLMWPGDLEGGAIPGKLFEYLGMQKPILVVGSPPKSEAAELALESGAGRIADDSSSVAESLSDWLEEKNANGSLSSRSGPALDELSSANQAARLSDFLAAVVRAKAER